ncbi:unnamed protein product [Adineta steineri]|uniref:Senescence domain-containing protein n=1 Tax=Adineta steineri TaxID=433720 RepID=A0A818LR41_9BILA|nr:unnamed protein product [Adineta steineri]CAF3578731.1 unnamed protein product [Adineta steineri]
MSAVNEIVRPRPEATATGLKRETKEYLERATNLERNHQYDEASILYKRVISLITSHEGTSAVDDELNTLKRNTNQRLLQSSLHQNRSADSNGIYQNMVRQLSDHVPQTFNEQDLTEMAEQVFEDPSAFEPMTNDDKQEESNAVVLFQLDEGARLFYIAKDGTIQTSSESLPLTIFEVTEGGETCGLLKLGSWIYPLHPKVSPAFKTGYDAYIFPNNTSVGEFVGLMFDESVVPDIRHFFEDIVSKLAVFMAQQGTPTYGESLTAAPTTTASGAVKLTEQSATRPEIISNVTIQTKEASSKKAEIIGEDEVAAEEELPYDKTTTSGKLAAALITGTKFLTKQLATGVVMAESLIEQVSKNVHDKIVPNPEPTKVSKSLHLTARGLRSTSVVAVKASSYVVSKVGAMTLALARTFAPNLGKVEKKVNPDGTIEAVKLSGIRGIGHAGLTSFGVIYESCENAAKHLATNIATESVRVVKHKYGEDASILTENAAYALGNSALTAYYVGGIGPKAIARKVVKQTAKETVKNAIS